jgi:YggT family protein
MGGIMSVLMGLLAFLAGLYSLLIFIRILLTWFNKNHYSRPIQILSSITDPYLDWWRQRLNLRAGSLDLSPIAALAVLSVVQTVCSTASNYGRISLGIILVICLSVLWSVVSFIIGFCFFVLVLRLIAYMSNSNMYSPFWMVINSISQPLLYRINRIIFGKRIVRFMTGILVSIAALIIIWIAGKIVMQILFGLLKPLM